MNRSSDSARDGMSFLMLLADPSQCDPGAWEPHDLSPLPYDCVRELGKEAAGRDALLVDCSEHGGIEVCRHASLAVNPSVIPVIAVGPPSVDVELKATGAGATGYLRVPITAYDAVAKVWQHHNITRRAFFAGTVSAHATTYPHAKQVAQVQTLHLCADQQMLMIQEMPIRLTPTQVAILRLFFENQGRVITRDTLNDVIWPDGIRTDATLTKHISKIVHLIRPHSSEKVIETLRGVGYKFIGQGMIE